MQNSNGLKKFDIPNTVTNISSEAFAYAQGLMSIIVPSSVTTLRNSTFNYCYGLSYVEILGNITSVPNGLFGSCRSLNIVKMTNCTSVPTLSNTNAFSSALSTFKLVVPDSLYSTWIGATNWTTFANNIIRESDYNAS